MNNYSSDIFRRGNDTDVGAGCHAFFFNAFYLKEKFKQNKTFSDLMVVP